MATPKAFYDALSAAEAEALRRLGEGEALAARLGELGFSKLGHQIQLKMLLKGARPAGRKAAADAGPSTEQAAPVLMAAPPRTARAVPSAEELTAAGTTFEQVDAFAGARLGYVFKRDRRGVGYYADNPPRPTFVAPDEKVKKAFRGNLAWLNESAEERDARLFGAEPEPAPAPVVPDAPKVPEVVRYDNENRPLLTSEQRAKYELRAGPYLAETREGKYAEELETVRVHLHLWPPVWGQVESIKMNNFKVRLHDKDT